MRTTQGEPIRISFVPVPLPRRTEGRTDDRGRAVGAVDNTGKPLLGRLGGLLTTPGGGDRSVPALRCRSVSSGAHSVR